MSDVFFLVSFIYTNKPSYYYFVCGDISGDFSCYSIMVVEPSRGRRRHIRVSGERENFFNRSSY